MKIENQSVKTQTLPLLTLFIVCVLCLLSPHVTFGQAPPFPTNDPPVDPEEGPLPTTPPLNLFALDYFGPAISATNGGDGPVIYYPLGGSFGNSYTYWGNFVGTYDSFTNGQSSWFEIVLPTLSNRDYPGTNRSGFLSFRTGVVGSSGETLKVYFAEGDSPDYYLIANHTGPGWSMTAPSTPINWVDNNFTLTGEPEDYFRLRFVYTAGPTALYSYQKNMGGVDRLVWENMPVINSDPLKLRIEPQYKNLGPAHTSPNTFGEVWHAFKLSWPQDVRTYIAPSYTNTYRLQYSTNGAKSNWFDWQTPIGGGRSINTDITGSRYEGFFTYEPSNPAPTMFFRLHVPNTP